MPSKAGFALRGADSFFRALEFLCSALLLGIFSWFLAYLSRHHQHIPTWMRAAEGISGGACIYTIFGVLLTCFLGGLTFFAFLAIFLDILFGGAFIAIAVLARGGVHTQGSSSPLGNRKVRDAKLQTSAFAVAIIGTFLFLVTAVMSVLLNRHHKKAKKYSPSPSNNYTSGTGRRSFFKRDRRPNAAHDAEELGALSGGNAVIAEEKAHHNTHGGKTDFRTSNDTGMTSSTAAPAETTYGDSANKYNLQGTATTHNAYPSTGTGYRNGVNQQSGVVHDPQLNA